MMNPTASTSPNKPDCATITAAMESILTNVRAALADLDSNRVDMCYGDTWLLLRDAEARAMQALRDMGRKPAESVEYFSPVANQKTLSID